MKSVPNAITVKADSPITLPAWIAPHLRACNTDFEQRIVLLPEHAHWQRTELSGVDMRLLEFLPGDRPRLSAQLRFEPRHHPVALTNIADLELLIQRGEFDSAQGHYHEGMYFRLPDAKNSALFERSFYSVPMKNRPGPAIVYVASGHTLQSDAEPRQIDTWDQSRWLPGPTEGTEVMALHGHGTGNVMLIRWIDTSAFKPKIDPRGEEVLVLHGALYDAKGYYPAGSWIRNPIVTWQPWGAKAGTVIYYKNGHFANSSQLT